MEAVKLNTTSALANYATEAGIHKGDCRPFIVEGHQVGLVRPDVMCELVRYPDIFHVQPDGVELNPAFRDYAERSAKVEAFLKECRANNLFVALKGWRDEEKCVTEYRVHHSPPPAFQCDTSVTCWVTTTHVAQCNTSVTCWVTTTHVAQCNTSVTC
uniref:DUF4743 domain-containing protein n=1 Tax=Timema cristinae TaxID=61476 RepID=A0A7R9DB80_TIMCR|nr:unnamed protein product [Timema cristinae]